MKSSWIVYVATVGCAASSSVPAARFANTAIVDIVDDRRDVTAAPESRRFFPDLYFFEGSFVRPFTRTLELPGPRRALGVNALDEVPDSTWFTNRIGVREMTAAEVAAGPVSDNPELHKPWTVRSTKIGGSMTVGFIMKDAQGVKYMIKFDTAGDPPELETGTHVVVNRLLWACGYNVPEDQVVYLRAEDLVLASDAAVKDKGGNDVRPLTRAELDRELAKVQRAPDGTIRALASRWIDGQTVGGHPGEGVREDDPNDRIPHELRRDLRGQYPIYAWLDAVDVTEGQYVDTWISDPSNPRRHYVKHYAVDFGKSLGAMGTIGLDWTLGHAYRIDFPEMLRSLATVGLAESPGKYRAAPAIRGVAPLFEAATFDPGNWHPGNAGYTPFLTADRIDKFWGAKIVARFTRGQIHAAVEAGRFSDPRAVEYITNTLVARQRATMAYWFGRVNPLDRFTMTDGPDGSELCFNDLAILYGLVPATPTHYAITAYDFAAQPVGTRVELGATRSGRACGHPRMADRADNHGYTILRIATERPSFAGETFVHIARDPSSGRPRVIGIWRR